MSQVKALFLNCTLKKSPHTSHTEKLIDIVAKEMQDLGATTKTIRVVDFTIPFSIHTHAKDEPKDDWPDIHKQILDSDIIVICSPIWFGVRASVTQLVLERISGMFDERDPKTGQYPLYNKVGACIVTGNEDGAHDVCANTLYNLSHMGCTIPPNVDCYWVGEAGPGPSFGDDPSTLKNSFTHRTARYLAENTVQAAKTLQTNPYDINLDKIDQMVSDELGAIEKHVRV